MRHGNIDRRIVPSHALNQAVLAPNETGARVSRQDNGGTLDGDNAPHRSRSSNRGSSLSHLMQDAINRPFLHLQHGMPDIFGRPRIS